MNPPETRIALAQLWNRLPAENRRRALMVLGRVVGQQLPNATLHNDLRKRDGDQNLPEPHGKEAGHESR